MYNVAVYGERTVHNVSFMVNVYTLSVSGKVNVYDVVLSCVALLSLGVCNGVIV